MDIHIEVEKALHRRLAIPRHSVRAEVDGGLETLHRVLDRPYQKSCAEAIAHRVPGVDRR